MRIFLCSLALGTVLSSFAIAQESQHVSFSTPAENTKYTDKTATFELGDVPNHILRVLEIERTYPTNAPVINGIKVKESWTRGAGERTDGVGPISQFVVFIMDNGDKIFTKMDGIAQTASRILTVSIAGRITSGTGRFASIRGLVAETARTDQKTGSNENSTEIEYAMK